VAREQAGWANAGLVEGWMRDNLQEVMRTRAGLPARQFMEWSVEAPVDARSAAFGDSIALLGHQLFRDPLPTGELLLFAASGTSREQALREIAALAPES